jgi:hypothetical protein
MTLKPSVICDVTADTPSMKKAIGPKLAKRFSANPNVAKYAFVLKFLDGVVTGRAVSHALGKMPTPRGSTLLAGEALLSKQRRSPRQKAVTWFPCASLTGPMPHTPPSA